MDNTEEILSNFGGVFANDLNSVLQMDEDNQENVSVFTRSLYIDINQKKCFDLPQRKTFNVLSINIQSINAKFNNLLLFLSILEERNLSYDAINIQETWLSIKDNNEKQEAKKSYLDGMSKSIQGSVR